MARMATTASAAAILALLGAVATAQAPPAGPGDPGVADAARFDPRRPVARELETRVPDGFSVAAVGDVIISRPLSQYAGPLPAFAALIELLGRADVAVGNLETTIFDPRTFTGSPYSWEGDWTVAALPEVAGDLRSLGFSMLARANNHSLDWGLEGMRETGRWLDQAGIVHAGTGEAHRLARAPRYLESAKGRIALVSLASTFRPTSESLPEGPSAPGRPGLSGLHVATRLRVPPAALASLAELQCLLAGRSCGQVPDEGELFGTAWRRGDAASVEHTPDPADLAEIHRSIRSAQQNADFVVVAIHSHECSLDCDDDATPRAAADFLKQLAHDAIDSGADLFVVTGHHNLGPVELYDSPARGPRPIFYGLGNFIWSDVQEQLPHDLFQGNRELLAQVWQHPERATDYDLTAPLNARWFANEFTFQSVVAEVRFEGSRLSRVRLHPVELGYGSPLPESGIPRLVADEATGRAIVGQIERQTQRFGLPPLEVRWVKGSAEIHP